MAVLAGLHAEGMTLVIVTHEPKIAAQCPRLVRLHDGRIAQDELQSPRLADAVLAP
jgi:putative ABC transport system ATP-binding protein